MKIYNGLSGRKEFHRYRSIVEYGRVDVGPQDCSEATFAGASKKKRSHLDSYGT